MADPALKRMPLAEFLEWHADDDIRYELIGGVPVAMAPGSAAHGTIAGTISGHLFTALSGRRSRRLVTEAGIVPPQRDNAYYHADLVVNCTPLRAGDPYTRDPVLIIEVLSPSTESHDRKVKLPDYRTIASVQEIVLIDQDRLYCEIHRRLDEARWQVDLLSTPDALVRLDTVSLEVPLQALDANVPLEAVGWGEAQGA